MSRVGKKPIQIPTGTNVTVDKQQVVVKGPKGELKQEIHPLVFVEQKDNELLVSVKNPDEKKENQLWGTFRQLIENAIVGVSQGFKKELEVNGVGYRVTLQGSQLSLNVGYSHPVDFTLPQGVTGFVEKNIISLESVDKQLLGETAAQIRKIRKPEPYKGKGIKYVDEVIRRKAGKQTKSSSS